MTDQIEEPIDDSGVVAALIGAEAALLKDRLTEIARQVVDQAVKSGGHASVADVVASLESAVEEMGRALDSEIVAAIDDIASRAVALAEASIVDARAETGRAFSEPEATETPSYESWSATTAAAIISSLTALVRDAETVEAAVESITDSDLSGHTEGIASTAAGRQVNDSRLATFQANDDIVQRLLFSAVNDSKTSSTCRKLSGVSFNVKAKKIPRPPLHVGCRSHLTPVTVRKKKRRGKPREQMNDAEKAAQDLAIYRSAERSEKKRAAREQAERMIAEQKAREAEGRSVEYLETRLAPSLDDVGTFSGYAAVWDVIDNHKTAFARGSLNMPTAGLPLLWIHDPTKPVGTIIEARDDGRGLFVRGKLTIGTRDGKEAHALLKDRAVTGLSIGFKRLRDEPMTGGRRILSADLKEVSLACLPSNEQARITEVRSATDAEPIVNFGEDHMSLNETAPDETRADQSEIRALSSRLDRLEARQSRAGLGVETRDQGDQIETRAWDGFLRRGRESLSADEIRSLRLSDDTAGGFLAIDQFVAELLRNVVQFSPIRQVARVANTSSQAVILPKRTGRLTASWVGETAGRPSTEPTYGQSRYPVHELACYVDVSNAMLEDSSLDIAGELAFDFAEEFGRAEGTAFVNGTGTLQPAGLLTDTDVPVTLTGAAAAFPTSNPADVLITAYHALAPAYRGNAVWMMNSNTLAAIRRFKDSNGHYLLATAGIAGAPETTLLGRPVIEAPDLPDIAAGALPIVFGDFSSGFRIFDRVALSVLRDPYSQATNGLTRFHARRRVAAGVAKSEAFRFVKVAAS